MLSVPSCKWSRSLGGEYVDGASCIYAVFVWRIPGALGKSGDTFGYRSVILAGIFTCPRSLYTRTISPSWMLRAAASSGWIQSFCGSSLRSPRLLSWTVWVRHLLCQPDNCNGKRFCQRVLRTFRRGYVPGDWRHKVFS